MQLATNSPRYIAALAISIAHALAIYAAAAIAPHVDTTREAAPMAVHFIAAPQQAPAQRPPEPQPMVIPILMAATPVLPLIELAHEPAELDRSIQPPPILTSASTLNEGAAPKLISTVEYVREPSPRYPTQSRRLKEQGVVVLRVLIDERGHACDVGIESSSGYARLDHAAREAVANAVFRPHFEDGAPRRALVLIPIEFSLRAAA